MNALVAEGGTLVLEDTSEHRYEYTRSEPFCMKIWRWVVSLQHVIQGSDLSTGGRLGTMVHDLGMENIQVAKPNPVAAEREQKAMFALSLSAFKNHIPRLFHFLINPWIRSLQKLETDPNYSVTFLGFIQVRATK